MMAQQKIESFLNPKKLRLEAKNEDDPDDENSGDNDILPSKGQTGLVKTDCFSNIIANEMCMDHLQPTHKKHDMHDQEVKFILSGKFKFLNKHTG